MKLSVAGTAVAFGGGTIAPGATFASGTLHYREGDTTAYAAADIHGPIRRPPRKKSFTVDVRRIPQTPSR